MMHKTIQNGAQALKKLSKIHEWIDSLTSYNLLNEFLKIKSKESLVPVLKFWYKMPLKMAFFTLESPPPYPKSRDILS